MKPVGGSSWKTIPDLQEISPLDFKTILQEEHLQASHLSARYSTIEEAGPDHEKRFVVRVAAGSRASLGHGSSKKRAEMEAARAFIETFISIPISRSSSPLNEAVSDMDIGAKSPGYDKLNPVPGGLPRARELCRILKMPELNAEAVAVALTNGTKGGYGINAPFRVLGSALERLAVAVHFHGIYGLEFSSGTSVTYMIAAATRNDSHAALFDALLLARFVVAEDKHTFSADVKSGMIKALLVPIYIAKGSFGAFFAFAQKHFGIAVSNTLSIAAGMRGRHDPKGVLLELCQTQPNVRLRYENLQSGLDNKALFTSSLFIDFGSPSQGRVSLGRGRTIAEAEARSIKAST